MVVELVLVDTYVHMCWAGKTVVGKMFQHFKHYFKHFFIEFYRKKIISWRAIEWIGYTFKYYQLVK